MKTTTLGKLVDLHTETFTEMLVAYLFVLAHKWKQLEIREMNNIGFYLCKTI